MKRLLSTLLVVCLGILSSGCGNVFIRGSLQPGMSTVSGTVSVVHVSTVVGGDGSSFLVTFVTFLGSGSSQSIGFCGDHHTQFPINHVVRTDFTPGQSCATLVVVVII